MKKLDLILIDSFQEEYYKYCPFLSQLRKDNFSDDLLPIIGYQQHLASLFSGCWPQEINVWNTFKYSPKTSIFKWIRPFSFLSILDYKLFKYFIDFVSYLSAGINDMMSIQIPVKIISNFDIVLRQPITAQNSLVKPNIFNSLRENQTSFAYFKGGLKYDNNDKGKQFLSNLVHLISRSDKQTIKNALRDTSDFKFIYLMELDHISHKFGIDSMEVKSKLKEIDQLLQQYLEKGNSPFMIISDHGMIKVEESIDVVSSVNSSDLVLGKDYLVFLESTIALFWFFNEGARKKIVNVLKEIKGGRVLCEEEKKEFGIDFQDNRFGDLVFLVEAGKVIRSDYYRAKGIAKAMHGYSPAAYQGIFLTNLGIKHKPNQDIRFIDIIPTIASFFGLPNIGTGRNLLI